MGIAEELREKAQSLRRSNDFVCKDFVAIEFGISSPCKSPRRCCDCYADMFERIAGRIDAERALPEGMEWPRFEDGERALPEGMEWPRFEDGELVKMGDEVGFEGETMRVCLAVLDVGGWALWCENDGIGGRLIGSCGERVERPERPDSWERIEEDAKLAPRDYLEKRGMNPEKTERIASMMADLVRRAKALAKAGE